MANYDDLTLEELREQARERNLKGRSGLNKDELVAALSSADSDGSEEESDAEREYREEYVPARQDEVKEAAEEGVNLEGEGHTSEASDPDNPLVEEALSDREAYDQLSEHDKELADLALDASGPVVLQSPYERVMTGAVDEEQAKEQEEVRSKLPDEFVGNLTEDVSDETAEQVKRAYEGEAKDYPFEYEPPLIEQFRARRNRYAQLLRPSGEQFAERSKENIEATQTDEETNAQATPFNQRAVLYTDGLSGPGTDSIDRAYRTSVEAERFSKVREDTPRNKEIIEAEKKRQETVRYGN